MPISELESNIEHIVNKIDRELQSLMCIFQRLTIWKKKKKKETTIRNVSVLLVSPSHSQNRYRKNLFAIDEETGFCPD